MGRPAVAVAAAASLVLALGLLERQALSQMISSGATDQPVRPLPPGMKAPAIDFRDVAAQAGLNAVVVSTNWTRPSWSKTRVPAWPS